MSARCGRQKCLATWGEGAGESAVKLQGGGQGAGLGGDGGGDESHGCCPQSRYCGSDPSPPADRAHFQPPPKQLWAERREHDVEETEQAGPLRKNDVFFTTQERRQR
jgi:hypothetical protein